MKFFKEFTLHRQNFFIAIETNGTIAVPEGIDWICVSPKANAPLPRRIPPGDHATHAVSLHRKLISRSIADYEAESVSSTDSRHLALG